MATARREFVAWQAGAIDRDRYSSSMADQLTDEQIAQTSTILSAAGALQRTQLVARYPPPEDVPGGHSYVYRMVCANKTLFELITIAPDGKIAGIQFQDHFD